MVLRSLQTRIIVFFVLLVCVLQGIALFLMSAANERIAKDQIAQELIVGERVFRRLREQNSQQLSQAASVLAATRDEGTIASVLENHGRRINANVMMLADLDKKLLADSLHTTAQQPVFPFPELIETAQQQGRAADTVLIDARLYQVVVVPVLAPTPIAWVAMGFVIDDAVALDLQALSGLQVSFLSRSGRGNWTVHASTLPSPSRGDLADRLGAERAIVTLPLADEEYETRRTILHERGDVQIAAVLQRSLREGLAPFNRLRDTLIALALASIALSVVASRARSTGWPVSPARFVTVITHRKPRPAGRTRSAISPRASTICWNGFSSAKRKSCGSPTKTH